jgi:beta-lactam-binding protein with PASTA domain
MALKNFFTGKTGVKFWVNIVLMILLVVAVPLGTLYMLDSFTHHGEKIEVPKVVGKTLYDAESMLKERDLMALVIDSIYDKRSPRGAVLEQSPKPGYEVKGGRVVYLTINYMGEPMAELPDVVSHGSLREAIALLQSLGFKLTPQQTVMGRPKDLVIGVKQGGRDVRAGSTIPRERPLTLVVGGGEIELDSLDVDDIGEGLEYGGGYGGGVESEDEGGEDFDIDL